MRDLAMDPSTPGYLILTSATHGAFRTTDGGSNWSRSARPRCSTYLSQVAIDPGSPSRVLISPCAPDDGSPYTGAHLYRSTDGGTSFSPVTVTALAPGAATCTAALAFSSTSAGVVLGAQGFGPLQPSNLVLRSTDSGATFAASSPGPAPTAFMASFNFVAGAPNEVLAANARGTIRRSVDDGVTFTAAPTPTLPGPSPALESQVVSTKPGDASVRYFISRGAGFFRSTDSGVTWTESNLGNTSVNARAIAVNPSTPSTIYVGQGGVRGHLDHLAVLSQQQRRRQLGSDR
ncbi:MAG: exo-alpha-sialidase [Rhodanobacteraceae bacterium]|nr:exo-alpha-sialidase [Rhodanobacteraceae bacterium]